jgi:hypothetical protein
MTTTAAEQMISYLKSNFPWLERVGASPDWLRQQAIDVAQPDEILTRLRQTAGYKTATQGIQRADGTLRMSEKDFFDRSNDYRRVLKQYGRPDYEYDNPADLLSFFEGEVDPNELKTRLETYQTLDRSSQDVKDAMYVYAGMKVSTDDLYNAMVRPESRQQLESEYMQRTSAAPLDYETWITRATEAGLNRITTRLQDEQKNGALTGQAVSSVMSVDPDFARQMADVLYGGSADTRTLQLPELMHAFEAAMIGSAASANGLALPDAQRVEQFRQAGVDRARALKSYGDYGVKKNLLDAVVQRATGGQTFDQKQFEDASYLHDSTASNLLEQGLAGEQAAGFRAGSGALAQGRNGLVTQSGFRTGTQ